MVRYPDWEQAVEHGPYTDSEEQQAVAAAVRHGQARQRRVQWMARVLALLLFVGGSVCLEVAEWTAWDLVLILVGAALIAAAFLTGIAAQVDLSVERTTPRPPAHKP